MQVAKLIIKLKAQKAQIEAVLAQLNEMLKREMAQAEVPTLQLGDGARITISRKPGRQTVRTLTNPKVAELRSAIEAEQLEMAEANADQVAQLEAQIVQAELDIEQLLTSPFLQELQAKLNEELKKPAQQLITEGEPGATTLRITMPKSNLPLPNWADKALAETNAVCEASNWPLLKRKDLQGLIDAYYGLLQSAEQSSGLNSEELFGQLLKQRLESHIEYWEARDKAQAELEA